MDIVIRKASLYDLQDVQHLNNKLFELEYEYFDETLNVGWTYEEAGLNYFKDMIENEIVFVASIDGKIAGYLAGSICKKDYTKYKSAELDNMFILEEFRQYGIGSKLLSEFKKYCIDKMIDNIKVTASSKNKNAIAFYMKNGFEEWDITLKCNI